MEALIEIIAKNPSTIFIAGGLIFLAMGQWFAWVLFRYNTLWSCHRDKVSSRNKYLALIL